MGGYASGPGPQTPLGKPASSPSPQATDPQRGYGTDSGLQGSLGSSGGNVTASNPNMAMGTDSGLTTPV